MQRGTWTTGDNARCAVSADVHYMRCCVDTETYGEQSWRRLQSDDDGCTDADGDATDSRDDNCASWYDSRPGACGRFDDDDFSSAVMCCSCGGGSTTAAPSAGGHTAQGGCRAGAAEEASVLSARALDMLLWKVDIVMREKALRSIMLPGARS